MSDFKYEIKKELAVLSEYNEETKELNYISYNDATPKLDIRKWTKQPDGKKKMGKGITLSLQETQTLYKVLGDHLDGLPEIK